MLNQSDVSTQTLKYFASSIYKTEFAYFHLLENFLLFLTTPIYTRLIFSFDPLYRTTNVNYLERSSLTSFSIQQVQPLSTAAGLPKPEQWLGSITGSVPSPGAQQVPASPRRAPPLHARAHSLGSAAMGQASRGGPSDPFDVEWAEIAARNLRQSTTTTNPFIMPNTTQAFQVQL